MQPPASLWASFDHRAGKKLGKLSLTTIFPCYNRLTMTLSLFCRVLLLVIMIMMPYSIIYSYLPCAYANPTYQPKPLYTPHKYYQHIQRKLFVCQGPAEGCINGLWNEESCQCDCIPPYCRDDWGECNVPSSNCGGNPWREWVSDSDTRIMFV